MLRGQFHVIRNEYESRQELQQALHAHRLNKILELEAKFGTHTQNGFESGVPYVHFERLLKSLRESAGNEVVEESEVAIRDGIRRITRTPSGDQKEIVEWERKVRVRDIELPDYDIRISINTEEMLVGANIPAGFNPQLIRSRTRRTFYLDNRMVQIDLTEVMTHSRERASTKVGRIQYEVEVEYHGGINDLPIFEDRIIEIFKLLRGTHLVYTNALKRQLNVDIFRAMGGRKSNLINKDVLVEARNIKRSDLVFGGIVGNPETNYMVTFKADGVRKMLILHLTGIWLVYPPYEFNLVMDLNSNPPLERLLTTFNGTVFDGELVETRTNLIYRFLAFDCLAFKGNASIQQHPYALRQTSVNAIAQVLRTPLLTVDIKRTAEITSPQSFFEIVPQFLAGRAELDYEQDGLMFIPARTIYNPESHLHPIRSRVLTRMPDVVKFKESRDITIDYMLRWVEGGGLELQSYDMDTKQNVPFVGDDIMPLRPEMIDSDNPLTRNLPSGTVVEYEWVHLPAPGLFVPRRIRYDKLGGNRLDVALSNWKDIHNPITADDLMGTNLSMTFAYHNRIKEGLYRLIPPGSNILDLGSGRGGDVRKWVRLSQKGRGGLVVAVEPNPDHIVTLRSRINTFDMNERVEVVNAPGEDSVTITQAVREFIPGGKVDAITLMLSLSFFWESDAHLNALVETIVTNLKPGGSIIFLTVNGTAIQQIMEPGLGANWIQDLDLGGAHIHLYPPTPGFGRALDFDLPGTIVGHQREYLVYLDDLSRRLAPHGINLVELHRAEDEKLLSKPNLAYSSIYSYGFYQSDASSPLSRRALAAPSTLNLPTHPLAHPDSSQPSLTSPKQVVLPPLASPKQVVLPPLASPKQVVLPPLASPKQVVLPPPASSKRFVLPPLAGPKQVVLPPPASSKVVPTEEPQWIDILNPGDFLDRSGKLPDDDTYVPVVCTWFTNVVRIATIGDGSCFIHAVLKAFDGPYQSNQNFRFRTKRVQAVRRDLAIKLGDPDPEYPDHTYWDTVGESGLVINTMRQLNDNEQILDSPAIYTLDGMRRLFNSTKYLGDEVYAFVAKILGIDIFILRGTTHDIEQQLSTGRTGVDRPTIFVVATGNLSPGEESCGHYETVGIMTEEGIQTVFDPDHPFVQALADQYKEDFPNLVHRAFDPDHVFVREFGLTFGDDTNLVQTTLKMRHVFDPSDPFVLSVNRLYPELLRAIKTPEAYIPHLVELNKVGWAMLPYYQSDQFEAIDRIVERIDANIRLHPNLTFEALLEAVESEGAITAEIITFINQLRFP